MSQDSESSSSVQPNLGPPVGIAFVACFLGDLAIMLIILALTFSSRHATAVGLLIYATPILINAFAIWWTRRTGKKRWLIGIIISTAMLILLDGTCFGLLSYVHPRLR